jgi:hypothetical protein
LATFLTPPGCTGLEMATGGRYDGSRSGRVEVDNPRDIAQIRKASLASGEMIREAVLAGTVGGPSRECRTCRFVGYLWQSGCPKGHGPMPVREPRAREAEAA